MIALWHGVSDSFWEYIVERNTHRLCVTGRGRVATDRWPSNAGRGAEHLVPNRRAGGHIRGDPGGALRRAPPTLPYSARNSRRAAGRVGALWQPPRSHAVGGESKFCAFVCCQCRFGSCSSSKPKRADGCASTRNAGHLVDCILVKCDCLNFL